MTYHTPTLSCMRGTLMHHGEAVCDEPELPRGEITKYAFVLRPLAEMAPELRHPTLGTTYRALWEAFDHGDQKLWPVAFPR